MTLGQLSTAVKTYLPLDLSDKLEIIIEKRNHLAHGFWFENSHKVFSQQTMDDLIQELSEDADFFTSINTILEQHVGKYLVQLGGTQEALDKIMMESLNGDDIEYPNIYRKPLTKTPVKIVQVYDVVIEDKGKTLIFETEKGELLEFCDVGLGWSNQLKSNHIWIPQEKFKSLLPMTLTPHPKIDKPWNYKFQLPENRILVVSLKEGARIFTWHITKV